MNNRLIIFTGKGGVGKTTLAMAYTQYLISKNINAKYTSFYQEPDKEILNTLRLPYFDTSVNESAEIYIANKLNSKTIASWIMHTHFFKSLFQMIPGLGHMILMGHILKELENNPDLTIVLDSPASGHALTMFESSDNFKKIFKTGLIVSDIEKMKSFLEDVNFLKTFIVALPNQMAVSEANELVAELSPIYKNTEIILNNSFKNYFQNHQVVNEELPDFLKFKITNEEEIESSIKRISHVCENKFETVVAEISKQLSTISEDK